MTKKFNIWETVYRHVRNQVTYGTLNPGQKLDERQICAQLGISRTPVREALKQLQVEGYIETIPKRGSFVTKYSSKELDKIYEILVKLEGLAVNLAAKNISESEISELRKMHEKMNQFSARTKYKEYVEENNRFHSLFYAKADNKELKEIIEQLRKKVFRYRYIGITTPGHTHKYVEDHEQILKALQKKNYKQSSKLMEMHVDRVRKILLDYLNKFP